MRDLFRFLHRQRNNLLFLALMSVALSMLITGNMHHRAQAISSSNAWVGRIYQWRSSITEFTDLRAVNRALAEELARERVRNTAAHVGHDSADVRLDTTLQQRYRFITAQVINSTVHKEKNFLTLDRGQEDGIHEGMGVLGTSGIVGMVREASPHFALVTSILNNDLPTSVQLKGSKYFGLLKWDTSDPTTASLTDIAKHVIVQPGDTVVTRGGDGVFPTGVPVGTVLQVTNDPGSNFHTIVVRLSEDLTHDGYVHVVVDLLKNERDTLEARTGRP
ncbi:MAG: rod shape-determining protein MreC [Flavobacteriales bacterium]